MAQELTPRQQLTEQLCEHMLLGLSQGYIENTFENHLSYWNNIHQHALNSRILDPTTSAMIQDIAAEKLRELLAMIAEQPQPPLHTAN